jgi:hypothetical protein
MEQILPKQTSESKGEQKATPQLGKLYKSSLAESYARGVMGGGGRDPENQAALDKYLEKDTDHRRPEDIEAWELLRARKISVDEFKRRTGTHM